MLIAANLSWTDLGGDWQKLAASIVLGAVVGLERELSEKPAGLKTNVLICLGSTLFTICSIRFPYSPPSGSPYSGVIDAHIAAQIVAGVGFLGAGAILREGEHVIGLTTAATIWLVAAIGLAVGLGHFSLAALAALGALAVQVGMSRLDLVIDRMQQRQRFRIVTPPNDHAIETVGRVLKINRIGVIRRKVMKRDNLYQSEWLTSGPPEGQEKVVRELLKSDDVIEVTY